ncbi:hypothetical protein Bbelb_214110 [Branchiostoma belcheri]|nr:hypothetical protein Bbelb_214110 [Branchiostoma belcheri]
MFTCVWIVFRTKDRHVHLCVDSVQHQGQACSPVCGCCSAPRTGMLTCVWIVFSTKDRHAHLCVDSVQHQGQACPPGVAPLPIEELQTTTYTHKTCTRATSPSNTPTPTVLEPSTVVVHEKPFSVGRV